MKWLILIWLAVLVTLVGGFWYMNNEINNRVKALKLDVSATVPLHDRPIIYIPEVNQSTNQLDTYNPQQVGENR